MKQPCGCCEGIEIVTPESEANRPGLAALAYRVGTYPTFFETMLARLSNFYLDIQSADGSGTNRIVPLKQLTTRDQGDPAIALLEAWAVVADVLTFYQERIANEGFLRTATERRSILELARLVGYKPRPGVASSVYLAVTVSDSFKGDIPTGTRGQSIPGTGETPQFFETSDSLPARDVWNNLKPRLTRPQVITEPGKNPGDGAPLVTGADVIDTLYFQGISTNLRTGDAVLFVIGRDTGATSTQQVLRLVESVDTQANQKRTEVIFVPPALQIIENDPIETVSKNVQPYIDKATVLFPGSDIAGAVKIVGSVASVLNNLISNVRAIKSGAPAVTKTAAANFIRGAIPRIQQSQDVAVKRGFTRLAAWTGHVLRTLEDLVKQLPLPLRRPRAGGVGSAIPLHSTLEASPLANLGLTLDQLTKAPSLQPANAQRLPRTIAQTFSPESDIAPRLLAAFRPGAASTLYEAWANVVTPASRAEAQAMRVKATFFASTYAGLPFVTKLPQKVVAPIAMNPPGTTPVSITFFIPPTLGRTATSPSAWGSLVEEDDGNRKKAVDTIPLDATYDKIKPGSWVAIDRPAFDGTGKPLHDRVKTYHAVVGVRTSVMDTSTGFTAKVTLLTLQPAWLTGADDIKFALSTFPDFHSTSVLRDTIVYCQSEPLDLAEEPLDTDIEGDSIELAELYDGIEPGRWIMVSGNRTDIPNVSGVAASELAMVAAVNQGAQAPHSQCAAFPYGFIPPFSEIIYTTDTNALGDRLVVGTLKDGALDKSIFPFPKIINQKYCDQVQLADGVYVNAYVPTVEERNGNFPDFLGLLVDANGVPYPDGNIAAALESDGIFAWRISSEPVRTILKLAKELAYKYDASTVTLYGNVVAATHGQTVAEVLGNGDASQAFQKFASHQAPLTYLPAATPAGAQSTLTVRVNEIAWHEADNLAALGPASRNYITQTHDTDQTSVTFGNGQHGARPPTGSVNIKAAYRYGIGKPGNVKARQISQLATRPPGLQGVINPLPATGGADRDSSDQARRNTPIAVKALDRLVSVVDYADFSRTFAGIGKASAARLSDGRRQLVHVTIAGAGDIPIDVNSGLYRNLVKALHLYGDPYQAIQVRVRKIKLLVISAGVRVLPGYQWKSVEPQTRPAIEPQIRAAMLAAFGFDRRELGQSAFLSKAISLMQNIEGVANVDVRKFDAVSEDIATGKLAGLAGLAGTLKLNSSVEADLARVDPKADPAKPAQRILPAELVFLTPDIPDTLILTEISG